MKLRCLLLALVSALPLYAQEGAATAPSTKELRMEYQLFGERLLFQIGLHHDMANDPLLYLRFHCGVSGETGEETVTRFIEGHENDLHTLGRGPHVVFIEARVPKKYRADLIPVARIGDYGLFAWPDTPPALVNAIGEEVRSTIQSSAGKRQKSAAEHVNGREGGEYTIQGQPVTLGDAQDLVRLLEQCERDRENEGATARADNLAKKSSEARHNEVLQWLVGPMTSKPGMPNIAPVAQTTDRPEQGLADLHKYTEGLKKNGYIPMLFVAASAAKAELEPLRPVMRVGDFGLFADPGISGEDLQKIEEILLARSKEDEFIAAAHLQGIDEFGDAEALKALVASTPEKVVPAPAPPPAPVPAPPAPAVAASSDTHASTIVAQAEPAPAPRESAPPPRDPAPPGHIQPTQSPGGIPCIFPTAQHEELKREAARRQATFNQHLAEKEKKIQTALKDEARQARQRLDRNHAILTEMLHQSAEKHRLVREQMLAHIKAEANRTDAISVESGRDKNGQPYIYVRNNTDIYLDVTISYRINVGGVVRVGSFPDLLTPHGDYTYSAIIGVNDSGKEWSGLDVTGQEKGADKWNYEGTWL